MRGISSCVLLLICNLITPLFIIFVLPRLVLQLFVRHKVFQGLWIWNKIHCSCCLKRRQKAGFLNPAEKLQNHSNEGKGKEKKKKAVVALLVFMMATLEVGSFGDNAFKNPARYI